MNAEAEKIARQIVAMARICSPLNNASENERTTAAANIERFVPRLVAAVEAGASSAPPPPPPRPRGVPEAVVAVLDALDLDTTPEARQSITNILRRLSLDDALDAAAITMGRDPDDRLRYWCGICWRWVKEGRT